MQKHIPSFVKKHLFFADEDGLRCDLLDESDSL